jgi:hypothetical protein
MISRVDPDFYAAYFNSSVSLLGSAFSSWGQTATSNSISLTVPSNNGCDSDPLIQCSSVWLHSNSPECGLMVCFSGTCARWDLQGDVWRAFQSSHQHAMFRYPHKQGRPTQSMHVAQLGERLIACGSKTDRQMLSLYFLAT